MPTINFLPEINLCRYPVLSGTSYRQFLLLWRYPVQQPMVTSRISEVQNDKKYRNATHQNAFFELKMHQSSLSDRALPRSPLRSLIATLFQTL